MRYNLRIYWTRIKYIRQESNVLDKNQINMVKY